MDIIKLTRELGKAIQQDERYLKFVAAREANEADTQLNDLVGKMQLIHMSYQHEASKEDANEQKLQAYEEEFMGIREKIIANPNMATYEAARMAIDEMMNHIVGILTECIKGEDPETCEPPQEHSCSGNCSSCGSDCH
ncbi:MAG: YlbF family regulator [Clostridia bacterium]|nr:YlbF family regulator [Clostridia bacterium]